MAMSHSHSKKYTAEKHLVAADRALVDSLKNGNTPEQLAVMLSLIVSKNFSDEATQKSQLMVVNKIAASFNSLALHKPSAKVLNGLYTTLYTKLNEFENKAKESNVTLAVKQANITKLLNAAAQQLSVMIEKIKKLHAPGSAPIKVISPDKRGPQGGSPSKTGEESKLTVETATQTEAEPEFKSPVTNKKKRRFGQIAKSPADVESSPTQTGMFKRVKFSSSPTTCEEKYLSSADNTREKENILLSP